VAGLRRARNYRTQTSGSSEPQNGGDEMNQENNQIVHVRMVAREEDSGFWPNLEFAMPKFFPQNYSVFETELKMNFNDFEMRFAMRASLNLWLSESHRGNRSISVFATADIAVGVTLFFGSVAIDSLLKSG
jgi:hypothetical protein